MRIEVRHPAGSDDNRIQPYSPIRVHSTYYSVTAYKLVDGVLMMTHASGEKSFVILGKGYSFMERTDTPR